MVAIFGLFILFPMGCPLMSNWVGILLCRCPCGTSGSTNIAIVGEGAGDCAGEKRGGPLSIRCIIAFAFVIGQCVY